MAPVQSRLVLAVSIPAAALAIFLSLVWFRRSTRKGHLPPPPPPDIQHTKIEQQDHKETIHSEVVLNIEANTTFDNFDKEISGTVDCVESKEFAKHEFVCDPRVKKQESTVNRDRIDDPVSLKSDLSCEKNILCEDRSVCQIYSVQTLKKDTETLSGDIGETDKVNKKIETDNLPIEKYKTGVQISSIQEDTVKTAETVTLVLTEKSCKEESVISVQVKETESCPLEKSSVSLHPEKTDTLTENPSVLKESVNSEMIKEETNSPIKIGFEKGGNMENMEKSELAEKLANLELDTMKMGGVDVKERDSANHSPSEIMLASPSMSNFSDAHSEGSSDSGKGHSDGTTSPSRTPAGGSSVSGDPSPSIYEFVIPQVIVGRLIGRHGVFLHEIMSATHTNIFIKVHPESVKLKICAIEGSQQDIDKALEMIRKKFPVRRYPKLTLERVSFVSLQHPQQLRAEDFHLQLIEGVNNDVILSSLLSPGQFFVQQPCHPSYPYLTPLTQKLTLDYTNTDTPILVNPVPDAICVCPSLGGWYRVQIVNVDEDAGHCDIKFVDYGGYLRVESCLLKQIRADFLMLPFQAVECTLANIQPIHDAGWSEEARVFVHNMTFGRVLQAQIVSYTEAGLPLVNLYTSIDAQVVLVNAELVSNGYAACIAQGGEEGEEESVAAEQQQQPAVVAV